MLSIEAHRAAIGRFSRKAKFYSRSSALKKSECIEVTLFMFLVTLWLVTLYGLVLSTMHQYFHYISFFLMVALIYSYSLWILKKTSEILCATVEKTARRDELMRAPSPSKGIKVFSLVPCNYLDTFVVDGRSKYLDTSVLDDGYWECLPNKPKLNKLIKSLRNCLMIFTCDLLNFIIFSSCVCIGNSILYRMNVAYCGLHDLESYNVSFLKLSQLLLAGDVESNPGPVNYTETPKGKGRPKKTSRPFNFGKPKVLNFTSIVNDNRYLKESNLIHLRDIKSWSDMHQTTSNINSQYNLRHELNCKVSLIQANIINIKVDAIVNAANVTLLGGGGIDKVIHETAGSELKKKCEHFPILNSAGVRCYTGECKVTDTIGCKLNCDYVFHTVGPKVEDNDFMDMYEAALCDCYQNCLHNILAYKIKSIIFPCISTGLFNFPNRKAAHIAINTVRRWLEVNSSHIEQIIFCTYEEDDFQIYKELMPEYFPISDESKNIVRNPTADIEPENLPSSSTSTQTLTSKRKSIHKVISF